MESENCLVSLLKTFQFPKPGQGNVLPQDITFFLDVKKWTLILSA